MSAAETRDFLKELQEAERFGSAAVRQVMAEALACAGDMPAEKLAALAEFCESRAYDCWESENDGLPETYLFLYDRVCHTAREVLGREQYHRFCDGKRDAVPRWRT